MRHQRFNDEIHRMLFLQRHLGLGPDRAIKPRLPMHIFRRHQRAQNGPHRAGKNLDLGPARQFANLARVDFGERQRHVSRHRRNAQNLEFRRGERQQYGNGIVLAGVRIDDDGQGLGHFLEALCFLRR